MSEERESARNTLIHYTILSLCTNNHRKNERRKRNTYERTHTFTFIWVAVAFSLVSLNALSLVLFVSFRSLRKTIRFSLSSSSLPLFSSLPLLRLLRFRMCIRFSTEKERSYVCAFKNSTRVILFFSLSRLQLTVTFRTHMPATIYFTCTLFSHVSYNYYLVLPSSFICSLFCTFWFCVISHSNSYIICAEYIFVFAC